MSIVVVNKGDARILSTLESLNSFALAVDLEVIVVDASSGQFDNIRARFPAVRWIDYAQPATISRTIAQQRNAGVRAARGSVVAFLDANCVPKGDWLEELLSPILHEGERITVGAVVSGRSRTLHDRGSPPDLDEYGYLTECSTMNIAIHRDVFDSIGMFDEILGYAEDVDFAWRAVNQGFMLRYVPGAVVTHEWDAARTDLARAFRYGVARVRLYRKHPDRVRRLVGPDLSVAAYSLLLVSLPLALVYPFYLLVVVIPLYRNRRNRPLMTLIYQLSYGAGVLSELFHVPVLNGQRRRPNSVNLTSIRR